MLDRHLWVHQENGELDRAFDNPVAEAGFHRIGLAELENRHGNGELLGDGDVGALPGGGLDLLVALQLDGTAGEANSAAEVDGGLGLEGLGDLQDRGGIRGGEGRQVQLTELSEVLLRQVLAAGLQPPFRLRAAEQLQVGVDGAPFVGLRVKDQSNGSGRFIGNAQGPIAPRLVGVYLVVVVNEELGDVVGEAADAVEGVSGLRAQPLPTGRLKHFRLVQVDGLETILGADGVDGAGAELHWLHTQQGLLMDGVGLGPDRWFSHGGMGDGRVNSWSECCCGWPWCGPMGAIALVRNHIPRRGPLRGRGRETSTESSAQWPASPGRPSTRRLRVCSTSRGGSRATYWRTGDSAHDAGPAAACPPWARLATS